jgi:glycosyltransferase involved in cell wall biosynthesis
MDNAVLKELNKVYTISQTVSQRLKRYNNVYSEAIYPPLKNEEKYYCKSYGDYIFSVSRLDVLKRLDLLITAMKHTKTDVKCKIAGKGPAMQELIGLTKKLGLTDRVEFLGYVADEKIYDLYADSLAVYFAPFNEDYGYITIESFRSKKPVITLNDSGGPLEFVENGINGYITSNDPKEIAAKIDFFYKHKDVSEKMGNEGQTKIDKLNITWDNVIKKLVC